MKIRLNPDKSVVEAIREGLGVKLTHGDTVVEIKDLDGKGNEPR